MFSNNKYEGVPECEQKFTGYYMTRHHCSESRNVQTKNLVVQNDRCGQLRKLDRKKVVDNKK